MIALIWSTPARSVETKASRLQTLVAAQTAFDEASELAASAPGKAVDAFRRAAGGFEALVADGVCNGKLYYNLGNAYLQLGDIGRAILNYRRAEQLIGSDPPLQANLSYARSLCRNRIESSGQKQLVRTAFFWHYESRVATRFYVALAAYVAFWGIMLARSLFRWRGGAGVIAIVLLAIWLSAGVSVAIDKLEEGSVRYGVTTQSDITVRKGSGEGYDPEFRENLHEGVEFRLIESRSGWYRIELPDGNEGWIRDSQAELI